MASREIWGTETAPTKASGMANTAFLLYIKATEKKKKKGCAVLSGMAVSVVGGTKKKKEAPYCPTRLSQWSGAQKKKNPLSGVPSAARVREVETWEDMKEDNDAAQLMHTAAFVHVSSIRFINLVIFLL